MKGILTFFLALFSSFLVVSAQDPTESLNEESGYYTFRGADILAKYGSKAHPIVSADKKGVYLDIGKKNPKRVRWDTQCMAKPRIGVSNTFVKAEGLNYDFFYRNDGDQEERAYDAIRDKERETSFKIGMLGSTGSNGTSNSDEIAALESERDEFVNQMETIIDDDDLKQEGHADSINLELTLTPSIDIPEAFCAVMADYYRLDGQRRVAVKVHRLGDLLQDIPESVSFSLLLAEGDYQKSRVELFLFTGDGDPLPTTLSRGLRMLSKDELTR